MKNSISEVIEAITPLVLAAIGGERKKAWEQGLVSGCDTITKTPPDSRNSP